jgi:hypothetical protein
MLPHGRRSGQGEAATRNLAHHPDESSRLDREIPERPFGRPE